MSHLELVVKGGRKGDALVPGKPEESLLIKAIGYTDKTLQMPPDDAGGKLSQREIYGLVLCELGERDPRIVGLSATVSPLPQVAHFLCGGHERSRPCHIVETEDGRGSIVEVLSPLRREPYPPAGFTAARVMRDIAELVSRKQSVLIFCNTRPRQCLNRRRLIVQLNVRIDIHRQPNVTVPGQRLRHLGPNARSLQVGNEQMPTGVEVGIQACVVAIA